MFKNQCHYCIWKSYHETTRLCLKNINLLAKNKKFIRFLDYGSGTGILGIAAKKLVPCSKISFVDVDLSYKNE